MALNPRIHLIGICGARWPAQSRVKGVKLASRDCAVQALTTDGYRSTQLITDAARATGAATPLMDQCHALYREAVALGHGAADMISVLLAIEARAVSTSRQP